MRLSDAGLHQRQTKVLYPHHPFPPWFNEDVTRDRSNRLLDVSRPKVYSCAIRNDSIQFFDFRIRDGDTTDRPVHEAVRAADPTKAVVNAVNHNIATRIVSPSACSCDVGSRGIGDMQGSMERAIGVVRIDEVLALGRSAITLTQFGANWVTTKGD